MPVATTTCNQKKAQKFLSEVRSDAGLDNEMSTEGRTNLLKKTEDPPEEIEIKIKKAEISHDTDDASPPELKVFDQVSE